MLSEASATSDYNKQKKILIIAGEESGDLHGSNLVRNLLKIDPNLSFIGHGGDRMKKSGVEIIEHISNLTLVGFTEVVRHLPYIRKVMNQTLELVQKIQPARAILIDYPGFNLRLSKKLNGLGVPVTYFILPQVWAWKENRYQRLQRCADQRISIIPFEKTWFDNHNVDIDYVGNPLIDLAKTTEDKKNYFARHGLKIDQPLLTLLPGSRQQEIDRHWPIFLNTITKLHDIFPNLQFIIGKAPNVNIDSIPESVKIEADNVNLAMEHGDAGLIASGTASLEAAIFNLPCVICYKTSGLTHFIGTRLAKVQYLSLTNLIADKKVIPEFIQKNMDPDRLIKALVPLLSDTPERNKVLDGYANVVDLLGRSGAYERAAGLISGKL